MIDQLSEEGREVELGLAQIEAGRLETQAQIQEFSRRRSDLLLVEGTDREIAALDKELDRLRLSLERFDALEPALLDRAAAISDDTRSAVLDRFREVYIDAIVKFAESARVCSERRNLLSEIRQVVADAGFEGLLAQFPIPPVQLPLLLGEINHFESSALKVLHSMQASNPSRPTLYQVKFSRASGPYRMGEIAGFPADQAAAYVGYGHAEFVDRRQGNKATTEMGHAP